MTGNYQFDESRDLDLMIEGKETNLQSLLSLLPEKYSQPLEAYQSQGNVVFKASIAGKLAESRPAQLEVSFDAHDVSFYHPEYQTRIEQLSFSGSFGNGDQRNLESTSFSIKDIVGKLGDKGFTASLDLVDLSNPHISLSLETEQELGELLQFYPIEQLQEASGNIQFDIVLDGRLEDLKNVNTATNFSTSGQISLQNVDLLINDVQLPVEGLNGDLIFNKSDLAISDLAGQWGQTDFRISGLFKNVLSYFFFENQLLVIQADLISHRVELEEILTAGQAEREEYQLNISPNIEIALNCEIGNLIFQRFKGRDFKGEIHIKDQLISAPTLTFQSAGGKVTASANINAQDKEQTVIQTKSSFEGIEIDSVFYVFKNFEQDFLVDSHLKGQIYADLNTKLALDQNLSLNSETLYSDISFSIRNGQLNQFEPMERLGKYIKYGDLSQLEF